MSSPKTETKAEPKAASVDTSTWADLGTNLKYHVLDGVVFLAIPVPTDKNKLPMTEGSHGKVPAKQNRQVATSHGNTVIPGTAIKIGVNAFMRAI